MFTLQLTKAGSFVKERELKSGEKVTAKRYRYIVTGEEEAMDQLKEDITAGFRSCVVEGDKVFYFTWDPVPANIELKRSDNKPAWFQDTDELDELNAIALRYPGLVERMSVPNLLKTLVKKPEIEVEVEEEETKPVKPRKPKAKKKLDE